MVRGITGRKFGAGEKPGDGGRYVLYRGAGEVCLVRETSAGGKFGADYSGRGGEVSAERARGRLYSIDSLINRVSIDLNSHRDPPPAWNQDLV